MGFGGVTPCLQRKGKNMFYNQFENPSKIASLGSYHHIPILFGANSHEGTYVYDGNKTHILLWTN